MPYRDMDILEFRKMLFLGGRISEKVKAFQMLAQLGYESAHKYAILQFFKWLKANPKANVITAFEKLIEFKGRAELLPTLKELTRITMILGDTTDLRKYKKKKAKIDGT